jgi:hypothetical protein
MLATISRDPVLDDTVSQFLAGGAPAASLPLHHVPDAGGHDTSLDLFDSVHTEQHQQRSQSASSSRRSSLSGDFDLAAFLNNAEHAPAPQHPQQVGTTIQSGSVQPAIAATQLQLQMQQQQNLTMLHNMFASTTAAASATNYFAGFGVPTPFVFPATNSSSSTAMQQIDDLLSAVPDAAAAGVGFADGDPAAAAAMSNLILTPYDAADPDGPVFYARYANEAQPTVVLRLPINLNTVTCNSDRTREMLNQLVETKCKRTRIDGKGGTCKNCRKCHKMCRYVPGQPLQRCKECETRGIPCYFSTPMKRGPKQNADGKASRRSSGKRQSSSTGRKRKNSADAAASASSCAAAAASEEEEEEDKQQQQEDDETEYDNSAADFDDAASCASVWTTATTAKRMRLGATPGTPCSDALQEDQDDAAAEEEAFEDGRQAMLAADALQQSAKVCLASLSGSGSSSSDIGQHDLLAAAKTIAPTIKAFADLFAKGLDKVAELNNDSYVAAYFKTHHALNTLGSNIEKLVSSSAASAAVQQQQQQHQPAAASAVPSELRERIDSSVSAFLSRHDCGIQLHTTADASSPGDVVASAAAVAGSSILSPHPHASAILIERSSSPLHETNPDITVVVASAAEADKTDLAGADNDAGASSPAYWLEDTDAEFGF